MLEMLLLVFIWVLNFGISAYNAVTVGRIRKYNEYISGWMNLLVWSVIIMSAAGFTWCYTIFIAMIAGALGYLSPEYVAGALNLGYMIVIFPILASGLIIWTHSIIEAYKRRDMISVGVAGWNTFANLYNWYNAFKYIPQVLGNLTGLFKGGGNSKDKGILIMVILVIVALCMGIITTYSLIKYGEEEHVGSYH
jgi:hypothetical protein